MLTSIQKFKSIKKQAAQKGAKLVVVTKYRSIEKIMEIYRTGHRDFGENRIQELIEKYKKLPKDINWHMIGHLQRNKVKYIAPFIYLIHSVDSHELLKEINKQAKKNNLNIDCLLQIKIAEEETKYGFNPDSFLDEEKKIILLPNVRLKGLMGVATNTGNTEQIRKEFRTLKKLFDEIKKNTPTFTYLSMGMSNDYKIALEEGATIIRVGSLIFTVT